MDSTKLTGLFLAFVLLSFALWQFRVLTRRSAIIMAKRDRMEKELFVFLHRQTTRRFQMNLLFSLASLGMLAGLSITPQAFPHLFLFLWGAVLFLLVGGMFLSLVDFVAVRLHYTLEKQQNEAEKIGLEYALKHFQKAEKEEKSDFSPPTDGRQSDE